MNIYVGNLSFDSSEDEIRKAFEAYGTVNEVKIIMDQYSGRSKGFGFVEMNDDDEGQKAITEMNGREISGRALKCDEARPRNEGGGGGRF